jgi:hypothetical protein
LNKAQAQIESKELAGLIYMVITFDDFTLDYVENYKAQLREVMLTHSAPDIYVRVGYEGHHFLIKSNGQLH